MNYHHIQIYFEISKNKGFYFMKKKVFIINKKYAELKKNSKLTDEEIFH